ncbi:MAG: 50S ribosomal protein L3, partial [Candidatus Roizmanbacteria bacterium]
IKMGEGNVSVGQEIDLTIIFKVGDRVNITGKSKGKGFQGVVKRHGFRGGSKTHGQSDRERAPGSIGQATTPGRVFKGKRMAGRMGNERICTRNLEIIEVYVNKLVVKGLVPGAISGIVEVKSV